MTGLTGLAELAGLAGLVTGRIGGLADATPVPSPSPTQRQFTEADLGSMPGLLSLLAFVLLAITIVVIWRSMNKRIKNISFDGPPTRPAGPTAPPPEPTSHDTPTR